MRRALMLTGRSPSAPGGVERYSGMLIGCLEQEGWRVRVVTGQEIAGARSFTALGELVTSWRAGRLGRRISGNFDVVITNTPWGGWLSSRAPRVNVYHGTSAESYRTLPRSDARNRIGGFVRQALERRSGARAVNIAVSESVKLEVERHYHNRVDAVIPGGVDLAFFRPAPISERLALRRAAGLPPDATVVLFPGTMELRKGIDWWNEVARRCRQAYPSSRYLVVTPNVNQAWRDEGCHYHIGASVEDVRNAYWMSDVVFFPSRYEGWGLVTLEAMACGLPVIGSPTGAAGLIGSADSVLGEYIAGTWSVDVFQGLLSSYLELPPERKQQLSLQARQVATRLWGRRQFCDAWNATLLTVCGKR